MVFYNSNVKGKGKDKFRAQNSAYDAFVGATEPQCEDMSKYLYSDEAVKSFESKTATAQPEIAEDEDCEFIGVFFKVGRKYTEDGIKRALEEAIRTAPRTAEVEKENELSLARLRAMCNEHERLVSELENEMADKDALDIKAIKFLTTVFAKDRQARDMTFNFSKSQSSIKGVRWIKFITMDLINDLEASQADKAKCGLLIKDALVNIRNALRETLEMCGRLGLTAKGLMASGETDEDFVEVNAVRQVAYALGNNRIRGLIDF